MIRCHCLSSAAMLYGLLVICAGAAAGEPQRQRLTLLHTSDLHGQVLPVAGRTDGGSLAQVVALVAGIRQQLDHPVLLLDSGDAIQGTPLEQLAHVSWGLPSPTITAMNHAGYQAMAVGNHEFDFGLPVLRRARQQAHFPFLSANTIDGASGEPVFPPFTVFEAGLLRIGVLGLITPAVPAWLLPEHFTGYRFLPPDTVVRRWVALLRSQERCDLVVVLAHTGFERPLTGQLDSPESQDSAESDAEDYAWRLAQVPGIDLLLTGHRHRDLPPQLLAGTIISQPRTRGACVTRIDLELTRSDGAWHLNNWQGENLSTAGVTADATIVSNLAEVHRRVEQRLDTTVAAIAGPVSVRGCRLADCTALELIHAVQLEATGAQLSLASVLSDATPDLPAGPVSWRWIYSLYVYTNTVAQVQVTGAEVVQILEHTARYYDGITCDAATGCTLLTDREIPFYNVDSMAGVSYRIDPTSPEGKRIHDLRYDGLLVDPAAVFTLAVNSYRLAGGGGVPHLGDAEVIGRSSSEMTDLIASFLARSQPWLPRVDGNWAVAPTLHAEAVSRH